MASGNRSFIGGDRQCHRNVKSYHDGKFINTCPHFTVMTVNEFRYPKYMATAECTCPNCYDSNGQRPTRRGRRKRLMPTKCVEIPYTFKVLKRKLSADGKAVYCRRNRKTRQLEYEYIGGYETFAIGCTCMLRNDVIAESTRRVVSPSQFILEYLYIRITSNTGCPSHVFYMFNLFVLKIQSFQAAYDVILNRLYIYTAEPAYKEQG